MFKFNKENGQVSRLLLVLAIVIFVAVIIVYLVMKMATPPAPPVSNQTLAVPLPVYEKQLENIDFTFKAARDRGNVLHVSDITNSVYAYSQTDLTTTERFIEVTIGAQNEGTVNTEQGAWDLENIIDSKGRIYVPENPSAIAPWLPNPNLCGALLKPAFEPTLCTKIYEVSKESTGLKIRVETGVGNTASNLSSGKVDIFPIDLIIN